MNNNNGLRSYSTTQPTQRHLAQPLPPSRRNDPTRSNRAPPPDGHPLFGRNAANSIYTYFSQRTTPLGSHEALYSALSHLPLEELAACEFPPYLTPLYHPRRPRPRSRGSDIIDLWYHTLPHVDMANPTSKIVRCSSPITAAAAATTTSLPPVASTALAINAETQQEEPNLVLFPKETRVLVGPHVLESRPCRGVLVLMRGLPGSGKSTACDIIESAGAMRCSADMELTNAAGQYVWTPDLVKAAHLLCFEKAVSAMIAQKPVVVDNTNVDASAMRVYIEAAVALDYAVVTVEPGTPWARDVGTLVTRTRHEVPAKTIETMARRYISLVDLRILMPYEPRLKPQAQPLDEEAPSSDDKHHRVDTVGDILPARRIL